jgi:hypothetical protein
MGKLVKERNATIQEDKDKSSCINHTGIWDFSIVRIYPSYLNFPKSPRNWPAYNKLISPFQKVPNYRVDCQNRRWERESINGQDLKENQWMNILEMYPF